ncbi:MAG: MFS transporter [Pseudomonadota bacterium]|nr:MFS transporter [Pseudomonadota bacterium]
MQQEQTLQPEQTLQGSCLSHSELKAWFVCLSAGLFFFYDFIQLNMFNTLNPFVAEAYRLDAVQIGYLASTYMFATVCMLPFSGALLDRFPTRHVILSAMAVCTFSTYLFSIAPNVWIAALARFICGGSTAFCFLSCIVLSTRWFPSHKMAQVTGVIVTMAMLGGALSQEPLAHLIEHFGWRTALQIDTALGIALFLFMYAAIENFPDASNPPKLTQEPVWKSYKSALANPQNMICCLYTSLMNLFIFILGAAWGATYLQMVYKLDFTTASRITTMLFFGTILGSPLAGILSDKMRKRRAPMILGAIVSFTLAFALLFRPDLTPFQLGCVFFIIGVTTSTQIISYPVIFETNPPSITGASEALAGVLIMAGGAVFQPVFGWMMNQHWSGQLTESGLPLYSGGDYHFAYLILPISLLVCIWLARNVTETNCQLVWKNKANTTQKD